MACKYKYNNAWYSKEELKPILLKERGILPDGKLEKPEIGNIPKTGHTYSVIYKNNTDSIYSSRGKKIASFDNYIEAEKYYLDNKDVYNPTGRIELVADSLKTRENTTSIESVKNKTLNIFDNSKYVHPELGSMDGYNNFESDEFKLDTDTFKLLYNVDKKTYNVVKKFPNYWQAVTKSNLEYYSNIKGVQVSKIIEEQKKLLNEKIEEYNKKEYTSQALTNLKVAALKEVARKYPRSLVTSKVVPINPNMVDNSEIQYSKVGTQERLNQIQDIFNENPELSKIGTVEQYASYLDTIFPDSKVKDIVYRGDKSKTVNGVTQFLKGERKDLLFLSTNKEVAKNTLYYSDFSEFIYKKDEFGNLTMTTENEPNESKNLVRGPKNFISAIVNIQNPLVKNAENQSYKNYKIDGKSEYETIKYAKEKIKNQENDSLIVENVLEGDVSRLPSTNIGLHKPEQIHILSSKKDLEMFRNFINFTKSEYAKYGDIQQFKDYIMSKNFAAVEEFLVVNNKIDRKC